MDHEPLSCAAPELGMYASDRDIFDRVWKRVMPEERADCPIVVAAPISPPGAPELHTPQARPESSDQAGPNRAASAPEPVPVCNAPETPSCPGGAETPEMPEMPEEPEMPETPEAPESPGVSECPEAPERPAEPEGPETPCSAAPTGDDFPGQDAVPCLGSGSAGHGAQLQEDIMAELDGWQLYRHLARRVTGSASRSLSALASEKHRQARRLAAAYFLISGLRYWPTDRLAVPRVSTWLGTLRRRFAVEQQMESRYRAAALDTADPCLADLYTELAEGCATHARALRVLLESAL